MFSSAVGSVLVGTLGLDLALVVALVLAVARPLTGTDRQVRRAAGVAALALLVQAAHFAEELVTNFDRRFPEQLGLAPWPDAFFVPFNLGWLAAWTLGIVGLRARSRAALVALWFLAIAGMANAVVHPLLALAAGGYFPGLLTSPFAGLTAAMLFGNLMTITRRT